MLYVVVYSDKYEGYFFDEESRVFKDYAQAKAYAKRLTDILAKAEGYPEGMSICYEVVKVKRAF